uniref:Nidogen-1 n=1 Tax=Scleropages formosus TaxID=113540 RepID=A0A8C9SVV1_SCLFO
FLIFSCSALSVCVRAIDRTELLRYGEHTGDRSLEPGAGTDQRSQQLALDKPLHFYHGKFHSVFVSTRNGAEPTAEYQNNMPASFGMIAAAMGNLDTSNGVGKVYFRQDASPTTLRQVADHINRAFPEDDEVEPIHALVVTWENVEPHESSRRGDVLDGKRNTFQLVVASTETASYAVLLYPRDGLQFHSTLVGGTSKPIVAGFNQGHMMPWSSWSQDSFYNLISTNEVSVRDLSEQTNSGKRGVWVYEIGTSPYFSAIAPGEVTDLPPEAPQEGHAVEEAEEVETVSEFPVYKVYPQEVPQLSGFPEEPEETQPAVYQEPGRTEKIAAHPDPVEPYPAPNQAPPLSHPHYQPENPQVVVVDDGDINVDVFSYNYETCATTRHKCSSFADCRDYTGGYCCHCRPGFYGNGKDCVAEGKPQRMNGKVSGKVFVGDSPAPLEFSNNDLHSYVVANDGRAYIAISTIPPSLGPSLLPLSSLGGVIGWAFALEQPGYENGFSIVGGEFTRQAEVTFLPGDEKLTIKQEFRGIDEHDHLVVNTELQGRLPEVPQGSTVQIEPYTEVYQYGNNVITTSSLRDYTVTLDNGVTQTKSFHWKQTIVYQSCPHDEIPKVDYQAQQLSVDQVFVMYDATNQLIRYAMSNKIGSIHSGEPEQNPCFTGRHGCDTNAACRPGQGNQFTCECATGFTGDGRTCYDIDECREMPQICGPHAICNNQPGTFRCECVDSFQFGSDGQTCISTCVDRPIDHCQAGTHNCDIIQRARCIYTGGSSFICSCLPGFEGDGRICQDIDECQPGRCHQDAVCSNTPGSFSCQCRPGFHGDGFHCSSGSEREKTQCERHRDGALVGSSAFGPRGPRPLPGQFIPTCDALGNYEPTQCHSSTGHCWCVDRNGQEIPGTRAGPGTQPMCIEPSVVLPPVGPTTRPDVSPLPPGSHLLFAQSGKIEHIPLDTTGLTLKKSEAKAVLHIPDKVVIAVAYDCVEKMVYWTEITGPSISKASLQGGDPIPVIQSDLESPEGIAVDHLGRTMFWTDSMRDVIEVASLDGSQRRVLFNTDLVNPRAIITDSVNGCVYLYWADWNRDAPKIETSYMDGTNRRVLVKDDLGLPNGLTYDPQTSQLCWADAGTHKVECITPSTGNRRKVLDGIQYPFDITFYGRNLYYTDWRRDAVIVVDSQVGKETDEFRPQKQSRLYGITAAYTQCPYAQNYCSVNNGGCTHLCLATPAGRSCLCPDNAVDVRCVQRESQS